MPGNQKKVVFAGKPETRIYDKADGKRKIINTALMGSWLTFIKERSDGWVNVTAFGKKGWVKKEDTRKDEGLKLFFIDVGQGDSCLIESGGKKLLVDSGPLRNTLGYLRKYQYRSLISKGKPVTLDAVFVSHFDTDHYAGMIPIIDDKSFHIKRLYHNGIARFVTNNKKRPSKYNTDLGKTDAFGKPKGAKSNVLETSFSTINDAKKLIGEGGLQATFRKFLESVIKANKQGRLGSMSRLTSKNKHVPGFSNSKGLVIEVMGPVPESSTGAVKFKWFGGSSHTRNGHSLVLKLHYSGKSILLGGDLNTDAEVHLIKSYSKRKDPFSVNVAKSCHHGSSDFTIEFLKAINAEVTVISSGDNESYSHPRSDAIGAAGKYGRGKSPLVFSTELARSYRKSKDILFGMINLRTDGDKLMLAQMKEKRTGADIWDSYEVPFKPRRK